MPPAQFGSNDGPGAEGCTPPTIPEPDLGSGGETNSDGRHPQHGREPQPQPDVADSEPLSNLEIQSQLHEAHARQVELETRIRQLEAAADVRAAAERRNCNLSDLAPIGIFRTDETGATCYVNPRWCELTGMSADQATGDGWLAAVHPDDQADLIANWQIASRRREASSAEYRIVRPDGSIVWVMGHATPERGSDGQVVGHVGAIVDITERKQAEAALRESNELLSLFIHHSPIYAFIKDVKPGESRVLRASENFRDIVGIPGSEMAGKTMAELFPAEFAAAITADDWAVVSRGEILNLEEELGGRSYTTIKFPIALGDKLLLAGYTIDITDRRRTEAALEHSRAQLLQSQKLEAVGRLAGGVAHDFNNILQALLSLATVLRLQVGTHELAQVVAEIEAHVSRGADLTQQLLLFSRRRQAAKRGLDLGGLVGAVGLLLERLIPENIHLSIDPPHERLWLEGDAGQLEQVLMNLALNARDAMAGGGTLTVRTYSSVAEVVLEVTDTGHGMDDTTRAHLFEPFFTTKESGKGTGLGLSVVHGIVEEHGGRIEVESVPGQGSCFRVILPAATPPGEATGTPEVATELPRGHGELVLLVEDEEGARNGLAELLRFLGYGVAAVGSGEEVDLVAIESAPDLLLTDLMLPGIDGAALAVQLGRRWPGLKVIVMSGYTEDAAVRRDIDEGSVQFLQKPFDVGALAAAVRAALDVEAR